MSSASTSTSTSASSSTPGTPPPASNNPAFDAEIKQAFARNEALRPLLADLAGLVAKHTHAEYAGFWQKDNAGKLQPLVNDAANAEFRESNGWRALTAGCHQALDRLDLFVGALQDNPQDRVVAAPIYAPNGQPFVLGVILRDHEIATHTRIAMVDHVAGATSHWQLMQALGRLDWEAQAAAAAAELVSQIQITDSLEAACFLIVEQLASFFQCDQVSIGLCPPNGTGAKLRAISGMSQFDRSSAAIEAMQNVLDEVVVRNAVTTWPPLDAQQRHATLAHRRLLELERLDAIVSAPLMGVDERCVGAIVLSGRREILHRPQRIFAVEAVTPHVATALDTRRKLEPSRLGKAWRWLYGEQSTSYRRWLVAAGIGALFLIPICPWRHKVRLSCQVEPVVRRYSVAPYDGILKNSLVRPGDLVQQGQVLARMDDRELRWELLRTMAELGRATKKRDVAMADQDTSEKQLAELEMERLKLKVKQLQHRESVLEVTSPISGVVLKGDLEDAEGAPVKVGQGLFEVAPLERVKLELAILEEDLPSVAVGMKVKARLDGTEGLELQGEIVRIQPRSEIRDNQNVFLAEVELGNPDNSLRPGMSGKCHVVSRIRSLGWIWFHKAWHQIRHWIG